MADVVRKELALRANATLLLGGMVGCAVAASIFDIGAWFGAW
jgi:hypothetical protein